MKIYPNEFWLEEFDVHSQDDVYFYHYEVVGRELFTWKFEKKKAYIVGPSNLHCTSCGMKYGSNGCKYCKPWVKEGTWSTGESYGYGLRKKPTELQPNDLYIHREIESRPPNAWKKWRADRKDDEPMFVHYACHDCKYFMYHHLNYCYKCGKSLVSIKGTYGDLRKACEGYRTGY